jgi:hypothetical protein
MPFASGLRLRQPLTSIVSPNVLCRVSTAKPIHASSAEPAAMKAIQKASPTTAVAKWYQASDGTCLRARSTRASSTSPTTMLTTHATRAIVAVMD